MMSGRIGIGVRGLLALALFAPCVAGCGAASGSGAHTVSGAPADAVELLALHPYPHEPDGAPTEGEGFHGYRVLGRATLATPVERERAIAALTRAERDSDGRAAKCFNPRHGLSVKRGAERVDYVICFECLQMKEHRGSATRVILIAAAPEDELDALLSQHGLKRAAN